MRGKMSFVTGLAHIGIRVHDFARSRVFYELLGFELTMGPMGPDQVAIFEHPSGLEINLIVNAPASDEPNVLMDVPTKHAGYTHIAIAVRDLAEAQSVMERAGHPITEGPVTFPNGTRAIFVRDPDRNVVELDELAPR
jgi:lactoylglutathione lyase